MELSDKVKKGLEACIAGECNSKRITCPYRKENDCTTAVVVDALAYIRELEARVAEYEKPLRQMTLEEVFAVSRDEGNIVWLEYRDEEAVRCGYNGYYEPQHIMAYTAFGGYKGEVTFYPPGAETEKTPDPAVYGIGWRCWPRRPTDEERKAAEWDV